MNCLPHKSQPSLVTIVIVKMIPTFIPKKKKERKFYATLFCLPWLQNDNDGIVTKVIGLRPSLTQGARPGTSHTANSKISP